MRLVVLGGTGFVGRSIVRELASGGHDVLVLHRGQTEPESEVATPNVIHIHGSRAQFENLWEQISGSPPEGLIDVAAYTRRDAVTVLGSVPTTIRLVALSSMDVYRASGALRGQASQDAVPLDESAPVRDTRYIYRNKQKPNDDYEKLDVEDEYLRRGATLLRLPMIYGEHDDSRREEFILRRCRARRDRIPVGSGTLLWSRGYVGDIARAARLAIESDAEAEIFNVCESRTWTIGQWARRIANAAAWQGGFVRVPDDRLPDDMRLTSSFEQHLLFDASKARQALGWIDTDPQVALEASVGWHLAHPPGASDDFTADEIALRR
ncbi:MAG TPA: NAD-dependent epimerase/dehydratase family protein [Actinomycetota bacterium]|nr:NAD-dependent epimerase/dehydratase family protein [Actinomycetota bacterium]